MVASMLWIVVVPATSVLALCCVIVIDVTPAVTDCWATACHA